MTIIPIMIHYNLLYLYSMTAHGSFYCSVAVTL